MGEHDRAQALSHRRSIVKAMLPAREDLSCCCSILNFIVTRLGRLSSRFEGTPKTERCPEFTIEQATCYEFTEMASFKQLVPEQNGKFTA